MANRDPEIVRANEAKRYQRHKAKRNLKATAWRQNNPEKASAHNKVARAIRSGRLKSEPCEECGALTVHAHHPDYAKPLQVRWLCPLHHAGIHRKENANV